ncbi:MAG: DUF115 domain-containing protein [Candidatus Thermoplasmatota archaeon]|nr:DUF115 domain-containing protein [Candidatus Thermoplasmatota archaeon]
MNLREWFVLYREISEALHIDTRMDFISSLKLSSILLNSEQVIPVGFYGRNISIFGPARINCSSDQLKSDLTIIADSALKQFLENNENRAPDIIVTDLDGSLEDIRNSALNGTTVFVHAHGDNIKKIERIVPSIKGNIIGTTQNYPLHNVSNFFGFTDGDRSAFIAMMLRPKSVRFFGFDFKRPQPKPGVDMNIKMKKLKIAEMLIGKAGNIAKEAGTSEFVFA